VVVGVGVVEVVVVVVELPLTVETQPVIAAFAREGMIVTSSALLLLLEVGVMPGIFAGAGVMSSVVSLKVVEGQKVEGQNVEAWGGGVVDLVQATT